MRKTIFAFISILLCGICSLAQNNEISPCPTITVTGPSGLVEPGDNVIFTVSVDSSQKLEYEWTVSNGEISSGQNSPVITVSTTQDMNGTNITASVQIKGLPENCSNINLEVAVIDYMCRLPLTIENYEKLSFKEEKVRLANVADEFRKNPDSVIYFIYYYPGNTDFKALEKRLSNVKIFLIEEQKIPSEKIVFVAGGHHGYNTIIYLVPSNIMNPDKN